MPRLHEVFRQKGSPFAPPTETPHDDNAVVASSKPAQGEHQQLQGPEELHCWRRNYEA